MLTVKGKRIPVTGFLSSCLIMVLTIVAFVLVSLSNRGGTIFTSYAILLEFFIPLVIFGFVFDLVFGRIPLIMNIENPFLRSIAIWTLLFPLCRVFRDYIHWYGVWGSAPYFSWSPTENLLFIVLNMFLGACYGFSFSLVYIRVFRFLLRHSRFAP